MTKTITAAEYQELNFQVSPQMKYRNVKTKIGDLTFDSKKEANYYGKLLILKKNGTIKDFKMQVRYKIEVNG